MADCFLWLKMQEREICYVANGSVKSYPAGRGYPEGEIPYLFGGKELYGIDIQYITEIIGIQPITEVPKMPTSIRGVINLRGNIIPVMECAETISKRTLGNTMTEPVYQKHRQNRRQHDIARRWGKSVSGRRNKCSHRLMFPNVRKRSIINRKNTKKIRMKRKTFFSIIDVITLMVLSIWKNGTVKGKAVMESKLGLDSCSRLKIAYSGIA